jgi:Cytochrome c oxidase subunit IV
MNDDVRLSEQGAEPPGELIHLPGPSYLPVITAAGLTLAVTGVVLSIFMVILGAVITLYAVVRWIGETRRETAELPLEHH